MYGLAVDTHVLLVKRVLTKKKGFISLTPSQQKIGTIDNSVTENSLFYDKVQI